MRVAIGDIGGGGVHTYASVSGGLLGVLASFLSSHVDDGFGCSGDGTVEGKIGVGCRARVGQSDSRVG